MCKLTKIDFAIFINLQKKLYICQQEYRNFLLSAIKELKAGNGLEKDVIK